MPGTLLAFDEAFPRATRGSTPIYNRPSTAELASENYPAPHALLAIPVGITIERYVALILTRMQRMRRVDRLILFGHGQVANAARPTGVVPVTIGIIMGANNIQMSNVDELASLRGGFAPRAECELWVCNAADPTSVSGVGGVSLCQAIADQLRVPVSASPVEQEYTTSDQEIGEDSITSTAHFLPWEGTVSRFNPRPARRAR